MGYFRWFRASYVSHRWVSPRVREQGCQGVNLSRALYIRCALEQGTCMSYLTWKVERTMVSSHSGYEG